MSAENPGEITQLLAKARNGDKIAEDRLAELLFPELERMASAILSREYRGHTMETGDLVNEIYLKASPALKTFNDSAHFKAYAARAMHHLLIDRARKYLTREKHFGLQTDFEIAQRVAQNDEGAVSEERALQYAALSKALDELSAEDPRAAQIVILRNGGLTVEEIAAVMSVGVSTVKRDWRAARAYLAAFLG
jgi:RNA polymerase sigma factor (TIGR02999 family)